MLKRVSATKSANNDVQPQIPVHCLLFRFADYAPIDCGAGRKLERFGKIIVDRPEAQALWQPRQPKAEWGKANAVFSASGEDDEKGGMEHIDQRRTAGRS